ncbi:hypothetical protein FPV67DRAFT_1447547 [Lyophyllum atratum]|nr:hypothetical protein FPV67DRAFT_1447547 [Lyophyllum atratum]
MNVGAEAVGREVNVGKGYKDTVCLADLVNPVVENLIILETVQALAVLSTQEGAKRQGNEVRFDNGDPVLDSVSFEGENDLGNLVLSGDLLSAEKTFRAGFKGAKGVDGQDTVGYMDMADGRYWKKGWLGVSESESEMEPSNALLDLRVWSLFVAAGFGMGSKARVRIARAWRRGYQDAKGDLAIWAGTYRWLWKSAVEEYDIRDDDIRGELEEGFGEVLYKAVALILCSVILDVTVMRAGEARGGDPVG